MQIWEKVSKLHWRTFQWQTDPHKRTIDRVEPCVYIQVAVDGRSKEQGQKKITLDAANFELKQTVFFEQKRAYFFFFWKLNYALFEDGRPKQLDTGAEIGT